MPDIDVDASEESEGKEKSKKRSRLKVIFILLFLLFLIVGMLGGAYWWFFMRGSLSISDIISGSKSTVSEDQKDSTIKDTTTNALMPQPVIKPVSLPSFTVNLSDPSGKKYLRVGIDVEVSAEDAIKILEAQSPRVRDAIILLLSSKTSEELASAEGKVILKNEIADRLNQILGAPRVVRIYFTDFVIQ